MGAHYDYFINTPRLHEEVKRSDTLGSEFFNYESENVPIERRVLQLTKNISMEDIIPKEYEEVEIKGI